jgi:hypothetical protein
MDMIIIHTHPLHLNFVSLLYPCCRFPDYFNHITIQQSFPIFHRKYYVIMYLPCIMMSLVYLR